MEKYIINNKKGFSIFELIIGVGLLIFTFYLLHSSKIELNTKEDTNVNQIVSLYEGLFKGTVDSSLNEIYSKEGWKNSDFKYEDRISSSNGEKLKKVYEGISKEENYKGLSSVCTQYKNLNNELSSLNKSETNITSIAYSAPNCVIAESNKGTSDISYNYLNIVQIAFYISQGREEFKRIKDYQIEQNNLKQKIEESSNKSSQNSPKDNSGTVNDKNIEICKSLFPNASDSDKRGDCFKKLSQ